MSGYRADIPKPLVPILGKPIVGHIIDNLRDNQFEQIILLTGFKHDYFLDIYGADKSITIVDTLKGTETADRLKMVRDVIWSDDFVLTYGDTITNFNLLDALAIVGNSYGVAVHKKMSKFGIFKNDDESNVFSFEEKPKFSINAGYYIFNKDVFSSSALINAQSLERDFLPKIISGAEEKKQLRAFEISFWEPIDSGADVIEFEKKYSEIHSAPWRIKGNEFEKDKKALREQI
jgi:NDP-sugar pyrophosphorylase family protein